MRVLALVSLLTTLSFAAGSPPKIADPQSRREALQYYRAGQELLSGEKFEGAAEQFRKAIAKDPLLTLAHYGLGQSYMALQRYVNAIAAYKECLEAFRTLHGLQQENRFEVEKQRDDEIRELRDTQRRLEQRARTNPGAGYELRATQTEQRLRDLERQKTSIERAFEPPAEVLLALGSALFRNGDRAQAELEWKAAAAANPKLGEAYNNLAVIYLQTGRKQDAVAAVKNAEHAGFRVNPQLKDDINAMR